MESLFRKTENKAMLQTIKTYAVNKFRAYYLNFDKKIANTKNIICNDINDYTIYVCAKVGKRTFGQSYNINNLFYELVENKNREAIVFDCVKGNRLKESVINAQTDKVRYVMDYIKKEYNVIAEVGAYLTAIKVLNHFKHNFKVDMEEVNAMM